MIQTRRINQNEAACYALCEEPFINFDEYGFKKKEHSIFMSILRFDITSRRLNEGYVLKQAFSSHEL